MSEEKKLSKEEELFFNAEDVYLDLKAFLLNRMRELSERMKEVGPGNEEFLSCLRKRMACNTVSQQLNDLQSNHELA